MKRRVWPTITLGHGLKHLSSGISRPFISENIGIPVLRSNNVSDGKINTNDLRYWYSEDPRGADLSSARPQHGDLLVNFVNGSRNELGKSAPYLGFPKDCIVSTNLFILRVDANVLHSDYLNCIFQSELYFQWLYKTTGFSGPGSFNQQQLRGLRIPLPPIDVQGETVRVLSTWDRAIDQTEALIATKERRKRALMQQLLTGRRRFPGCTKPWHTARLADLFDPVYRTTTEEIDAVLSISSRKGFERQEKKYSKIIAGKNIEHYILLRKGEFAYNKGNSKTYPQGCVFRLDSYEEAVVPNVYFCFRIKDDRQAQSDFFKFVFEAGLLNSGLRSLINTGVRNNGLLNIHEPSFYELALCYPDPAEQQRIAAVLNICDQELRLLRTQLTALKLQKRGLMQKLLTGEVRVPMPSQGEGS